MFGKLLGTIIGLAAGLAFDSVALAAVLASVGLVLGHLVDARNQERLSTRSDDLDAHLTGTPLRAEEPAGSMVARDVCALLIEIARVDAAVSRVEMRAIRKWLEENLPQAMHQAPAFLKTAISSPAEDIALLCQQLLDAPGAPDRLELLEALYAVAQADGPLNALEREALRRAAEAFGMEPRKSTREAVPVMEDLSVHYAALGLPPEATHEEIKAAYRRLARNHHPDRAAHLGSAAVEDASNRFRAIHEAYEALKRSRGM